MRLGPKSGSLARFAGADLCGCCIGGHVLTAFLADIDRRAVVKGLLAGAGAGLAPIPAVAEGDVAALVGGAVRDTTVTVFTAKTIDTMDAATEGAEAVAVAGGRILAVGSREAVNNALHDRAFTLDDRFRDKVLMPGLIEQHLHPILGALTLSVAVIAIEDWELPDGVAKAALTPQDYRARLRQAEAALKDPSEFLFTWGYHQIWHGPISRADLDGLSATRPIAVWHRSAHEFYLNSAALKAFGITEESTKGKGHPSEQVEWDKGHFYEAGIELIIAPLLKAMATPERLTRGLAMLVRYLHSNGVTALCEPGAVVTPQLIGIYQKILGADATPFSSFFIADGRSIFEKNREAASLAVTEQLIASMPVGKVRFLPKQIKLFADGAIISQLMQMKDGYTDGHAGQWIAPPADIAAAARLYWDAGYQIHTHVNGDLGLEVLLDALEGCMRENPRIDHRCVIVHFANSTEDQVDRIARLGAIVSANPYYVRAFADAYGKVGLGPQRADNMVRAQSVVRRDVPFSLHSDLPMAPAKPLFLAWCAVTRVTPSGRIAAPDQRITVEQALRAITIDAAQSWRMEHEMGSITPGKVANFTVLEEDPRKVDPMRLKDIGVWGTVFEGRVFQV